MKITKLELLKVRPRWMFLKMYTDTDLVGLGEPVLEGHNSCCALAYQLLCACTTRVVHL